MYAPPVNSSAPWSGIFPAVLTMFDENGRLDSGAMREHVSGLVEEGAHGIVACGTTGEFLALSEDERIDAIAATVAGANGRVPVVAGTGAYTTDATIRLTRRAAEVGAGGAIVILPYYMRPQRHELLRFYVDVAAESPLPLMLYNNPTNSAATPLNPTDVAWLYREGAIHAIKSTMPTVHQVHEIRAATDEGFRTFYGSFMAPLEGLAGGAHGWVSGILNVVLRDALELFAAISERDLDAAHAAWRRILPYKLLYTEAKVGTVGDIPLWRAVLDGRGLHGGHSRKPLLELTAEQRRALATYLHQRSPESAVS